MDKRLCENFHDYFKLLRHTKNTRGNNSLLKLPTVKLEFERKRHKRTNGQTDAQREMKGQLAACYPTIMNS